MKVKITIALAVIIALTISAGNSLSGSSNSAKGKELFVEHCSKCHRKDGAGIKSVYPPLKNADYITKNESQELLRGMLFGRSGKITVNGVSYNGVMTTEIDASLNDDNIAVILNYVYSNLNGVAKSVSAKDVKSARRAGKLPVRR